MDNKALVLLSGGQDSTTCLFWAINNFDTVEAVGFNYNQRHKLELDLAKEVAANAGINFRVLNIDVLSNISKNALTDQNLEVQTETEGDEPPNTLVEGRNLLFINYASIYAKTKDIHNLVLGVSQTDYSNYPDCRNEFILSAKETVSLALDYKIEIHTPLMWKSKAETWLLAKELNCVDIIKEKTLTCYNGIPGDGCGNCPSCQLRAKGWDEYLTLV